MWRQWVVVGRGLGCMMVLIGAGIAQAGVLTALSNCEGKRDLHRVHFSANGKALGSGEVVYEGASPVIALAEYGGGVLAAFAKVGGRPGQYRAHFSANGKALGSGEVVYEGVSPVTAMTSHGSK